MYRRDLFELVYLNPVIVSFFSDIWLSDLIEFLCIELGLSCFCFYFIILRDSETVLSSNYKDMGVVVWLLYTVSTYFTFLKEGIITWCSFFLSIVSDSIIPMSFFSFYFIYCSYDSKDLILSEWSFE